MEVALCVSAPLRLKQQQFSYGRCLLFLVLYLFELGVHHVVVAG